MMPHQDRVVQELRELADRRVRLHSFLCTDTFNRLPTDEQTRLRKQEFIMIQYEAVLQDRIANFPK